MFFHNEVSSVFETVNTIDENVYILVKWSYIKLCRELADSSEALYPSPHDLKVRIPEYCCAQKSKVDKVLNR